MRWLCDECVDAMLVEHLRRAGHDVVFAVEGARGAADDEIADLAARERRLLLTEDKDFGELAFRVRAAVPGLVLLRIDPRQRELKWHRLEAAITHFVEKLMGKYTVVEEARFRTRPLWIALR